MFKAIADQVVGAQLVLAATGAAATGLTVTVQISKNGGAFATAAGTVAEVATTTGYYKLTATSADTDADHLAFRFTGTGAVPVVVQVETENKAVADRLAAGANTMNFGTVTGSGSSTTVVVIKTIGTTPAVNALNGRVLLFERDTGTAGLRCQGSPIVSNTATTITLLNALTTAPLEDDKFAIS